MAIDNTFMAKKIRKYETIYVLYSTATNMPFAECDEQTFRDQVYVFANQDELQQYAKIYTKQHYTLKGIGYPNNRFDELFDLFYEIGVDTVQVVDQGAPIPVPLAALAPPPDYSGVPGGDDMPRSNPTLQLTGIYFMQDLRRQTERTPDEKKHLRELEEELAVNMCRSSFLVCFDTSQIKGKWKPGQPTNQLRIPFIKNKSGKVYQPVFTDYSEFRRFAGRQKNLQNLTIAIVSYDKLAAMQSKSAEAFAINPGGFNLILSGKQLEEMKKRYAGEA